MKLPKFKWPFSAKKEEVQQINNTQTQFYGKKISLTEALKVTEDLVDYFEALKYGRLLPKKPHQSLGYVIRCNAITHLHYTNTNLKLKGITYRNWALTQKEVLATWLWAHEMNLDKPLITLNGTQLKFTKA